MKISVIVPVYNSEKTIDKCLDSLVNQSLSDIEIIVINDGSTDNCDKIITGYLKKFPSVIKYYHRENKGIGFTRNEGIKKASGKFLGFVDSDDYVEKDMFEKMYNKIISTNADIVVCNYKVIKNGSIDKTIDVNLPLETNLYDQPKILNNIDFAPWNKLYKKELFNDISFPENLKYEDLSTIIKVFSKATKIVKVSDYFYNYLINPSGETITIDDKIFDIFKIFDDLLAYFENCNNYEFKRQIKILCCRKLFVYTELSLNNYDFDFSLKFLDKVYVYLNKNFNKWKKDYILSSSNLKTLGLRIIQLNKKVYIKRLRKKLKSMR